MQNTTADYKLEINKPSRSFECKITIGNNIYTNEDLVNLTLEYTQPQEGFAIGNTISKSLDLTLLNRGDIIYSTSQIKVEIGLKIGSKIEYILMGIFNIDDIDKTDYTTKITAYDNMIKFETDYFSELGDKPTLKQVVNELSSKTGIEFIGSLPDYNVSKLEGFTCREVLSYVASICGGNAFITRDGKFTIKSLSEVEKSIDGNNYFDYTREEVKYKIGEISCQVDENNILSKGSTGTDSMELGFENPWITETILTEIYNKLKGLEYLGYSMKWQGDISLDPYDIITVTDIKNVVRKIPILSQKISYTGGLTSEIGAKGETKNKNSFSSSGSTINKVNRAVIEQAIIKEALIGKANIKDLEAVSIRTQNLEAKTAKIEEAIIDVAYVSDLTAINANIQELFAADATINNALIGKANITDLTATNIKFEVASGGTLDLQTLLAKHITGENGQFINISSSNTVIANATIKNAMIESLSVDKLLAGKISTNKFTISSDNGGIEIVGATQQFKDKNNKVRIQMGQDATGNFNFILRGEDGTTTLIDHTGIKEKAIADDLIKSNMVAADAIGEKQINYSSLITGLNKDNNTSLIKASKVAIDLTGQSLEVSFNSLKSNVNSKETRNLLIGTSKELIEAKVGQWEGDFKHTNGIIDTRLYGLKKGDKITLSVYMEVPSNASSDMRLRFTCSNDDGETSIITGGTIVEKGNSGYSVFTLIIGDYPKILPKLRKVDTTQTSVDNIKIKFQKLEIGENPNPIWIAAPEDTDYKIESNTTAITVAQGKIDGLISENTIIKGDITIISDKYTSLKATVDGINTTVASHTSSIGSINTNISGLSGKVTTVENNYASLSQNLEGFKTTVSNTYSTKTELSGVDGKVTGLTSRVSTAEASITQLNNQIKLKVEATDITNAINNMDIGVSNLLKGTSKELKSVTFGGWDYYFPNNLTSWEKNKKLTGRIFLKPTNQKASCMLHVRFTDGTYKQYKGNIISAGSEGYSKVTITVPDRDDISRIQFSIRHSASSTPSDTVYYKEAKVEKGDKATDWSPAIEDVDSSIANVQTQVTTTSNKVATIETNLSSITQRVSATETEVTTVTNDLNNLQIGTRNLMLNSAPKTLAGSWAGTSGAITLIDEATAPYGKAFKATYSATGTNGGMYKPPKSRLTVGSKYSWSVWIKGSKSMTINIGMEQGGTKNCSVTTSWQRFTHTFTATDRSSYAFIMYVNGSTVNSGDYYLVHSIMVEEGTKPSSWNPAPEDINSDITSIDTKITTTSNKVATIETSLSSITSRVSSTESSITTINGNVTSLQSRMNTAEQKITPTAITTTISSVITGGTGSISTTQFVMDKNGLAIKNGALTIKNKAGTTVFQGDTNGNLVFTGTAKSQNGAQWVSLDSGGVTFQDSQRNEQMLRIGLSYFSSARDMNGVALAMPQYSDFLRIQHIAKTDLTNGWTASDTQYNFMDFWSGDQTVDGVAYKKGVNVYAPMYINNRIKFKYSGSTTYTNDILSAEWNTINGLLGLYGDNGAILGYQSGSNLNARIVVTEGAHPGTGDQIKSWGNWNCSGYTVHNATFSGKFVNSYANEVTRTFTETHCIEAENKQVRINFTDIQLVDGKAILNIPKAYIGINSGYIVNSIVKKGKGDIWVSEEQENRFVIEGTTDIKVNIEVIINLDNVSPYSLKSINDTQLCIDMTTGQPIGA